MNSRRIQGIYRLIDVDLLNLMYLRHEIDPPRLVVTFGVVCACSQKGRSCLIRQIGTHRDRVLPIRWRGFTAMNLLITPCAVSRFASVRHLFLMASEASDNGVDHRR